MSRSTASLLDAVSSFHDKLAAASSKYERRPAQQKMTEQVVRAFTEQEIALIEAGTGRGNRLPISSLLSTLRPLLAIP